MTTTRHLVNHRRRVATSTTAASATPTAPAARPASRLRPPKPLTPPKQQSPKSQKSPKYPHPSQGAKRRRRAAPAASAAPGGRWPGLRLPHRPSTRLLTVLLAVFALACGGFAAYAGTATAGIDSTPARQNSALTDAAGTSELTGQLTSTIDNLFSYDYTQPSASSSAQRRLTGAAVKQYKDLLAPVRASAAKEKLVLTTTVTYSGVEMLHGEHARVLFYADQRSTRTDTSATDYGAAMLAVDAVRRGATWLITDIDTYTG